MRRLELRDDAFEIMSGRPDYNHHCTRMVGVDRWRGKEDRIPSDQAVVDETFCEGLCTVPTFELRLLDGMNPTVPEVTVLIHGITKDRRARKYRLHIKKVLGCRHWHRRRQKPKR